MPRKGCIPNFALNKPSKYRNIKCDFEGHIFDSKKERDRYIYLKELEKQGLIHGLECQVKFELAEAVREADSVGARGGKKKGKLILPSVCYVADFVYYDENGKMVVEDTKSKITKTPVYEVKKKWLYQKYRILISEV